MPGFNGSGTFVRTYSWQNDAAANIKIRADRMDTEDNGFATGLSTCITKDGQTTITANLPMAGYLHTGVGAATARTNYAQTAQVQDGSLNWVDGGGTADAITASYSIPLTALVDGQLCFVRATAANATTTPTFSPSGLTARTIVKNGGSALAAGDIAGDGHELILRYLLASTRWELMNPATGVSAASTTVSGIVELATVAEALAGTDTTRAITSDGLKAAVGTIQQNSKSADYTLALTDVGGHILHPASDANDRVFTIPANGSVAFPVGSAITIVNLAAANTISIPITTDTLTLAGLGTTGTRTLAAYGVATLLKTSSTGWVISGTGLT